MTIPTEACWPAHRAGEALLALVDHSGLGSGKPPPQTPFTHPCEPAAVAAWLEHCAELAEIEIESFATPYRDVAPSLTQSTPALLRLSLDGRDQFLALCGGGRNHLLAMTPEQEIDAA